MKSKKRMHVLLTNDDGIYAKGIEAIYKELIKFADVTVVAPESEQSSVGHGITLYHPLFAKKVHRNNKLFGYAVSGKPADCVKFATEIILTKKPDLVVSGINFGGNDGCSVFYSGTVAGAREGAMLGIKSLAISLNCDDDPNFAKSAKIGAQLAKLIYNNSMPHGTFLNVNIPQGKVKGIRFTRQGTEPIHGKFETRQSPSLKNYYWMTGTNPPYQPDHSVDTYALHHGYATVTPIHCDLTDYTFLNTELTKWKLRG